MWSEAFEFSGNAWQVGIKRGGKSRSVKVAYALLHVVEIDLQRRGDYVDRREEFEIDEFQK